MFAVRLKPGHVQPVWAGHPWIYAQAIDAADGKGLGAIAGDEVSVLDPRGNLLGRGFYSPGSAIPVRILVRDASTQLDAGFFRERFSRAVALRASLGLPGTAPGDETTGFRLVHAEGDGLPGLVVDRYGDALAVQFGTVGMKQREAMIHEALWASVGPTTILDRTSAQTASMEGFEPASGTVRGAEIPALEFAERGLKFRIPVELGQKTGFYFDQRALRGRVEQLARGKRVLDAYAYVGAFALAAARGGASEVLAVEESALAVQVGTACAAANGVGDRVTFMKGDARRVLAEAEGTFDLVIADPPRLAPTRGAREQALLAYTKLAENACRATRSGGIVVICSCSAVVDLVALTRALATGASRANAQATILERWFQGLDHPVPAAFGEGLYLKAIIARVETR
jgi:23S rRNA (cytosine1962-C5)-methyltransferase